MKIKSLFKKMVDAEKKLDVAEKEWDADLDNEKLEARWNELYKISHEATEEVVNEIMKLIKVDHKTARSMVIGKRKELESLINRIA